MTIRAVALDLDGTLLDTIGDLAAAANAMRIDMNLPPLDTARIQSHVGGGMVSLVHRALTDDRNGKAHPEAFDEGFARFTAHYERMMANTTRPYAGVVEGLTQLQAMGLKLACVTNKSIRFSPPLLDATGIGHFFDLTLGGDSLAEKKPHPLPLQHTAAHFGISCAELLMVGDSHYDYEAARNAGSPVLLLTYGYEDVRPLAADRIITSLVEAVDFVKNHA